MNILITGNMGYVGPGLVRRLRSSFPGATLTGFDMGYFAHCLTNVEILPECLLDRQYYGDVRNFPEHILEGIDAVVYLSAISNDPMGNIYENATMEINYRAGVALASMARGAGVRAFVFASSCSMYGAVEGRAKTEEDALNPLTAYARSKVLAENELKPLASGNFKVTALRFATACGMSNRLRLDLVLNDFVACAVAARKISILSDGSPWRPLIHVEDMALAIEWAIIRENETGGDYLAVNVGSNTWNYQVKDLAEAVARIVPGTEISINTDAPADPRSYRVNFDQYKELAPVHQPVFNLATTIIQLKEGLEKMAFEDKNFRNSRLMRLKVLTELRRQNYLDEELRWAQKDTEQVLKLSDLKIK